MVAQRQACRHANTPTHTCIPMRTPTRMLCLTHTFACVPPPHTHTHTQVSIASLLCKAWHHSTYFQNENNSRAQTDSPDTLNKIYQQPPSSWFSKSGISQFLGQGSMKGHADIIASVACFPSASRQSMEDLKYRICHRIGFTVIYKESVLHVLLKEELFSFLNFR